ncbi:hypothetical protein KML24008_28420 [Alistipes onderdonkii]|jgi:glycosyltransferase involved in cell wall biosynthesis|uniref:glycosyltransferase family 4 protein n=1 Tax=Alistipes onderdonkii TaxID=328813 RepID=UPI0036F243B0
MKEKKLKVVWLCHFVNDELNDYFGIQLDELSRWMDAFFSIVRGDSRLDIHVVAPNYWTNEDAEVRLRGITYHLYKYHFVNIRKLISFELVFSKERAVQKKIHHIIQEIAPDVIHLFGSENIGYSCGIVPYAKNKNVVISLQGFVNRTQDKVCFPRNIILNYRKRLERKINTAFTVFSLSAIAIQSGEYKKECPSIKKVFELAFPTTIPQYNPDIKKQYDIVFWGRVCVDKGVIDLLQAIALLRKEMKDIRALIIGKVENAAVAQINSCMRSLNLQDSVHFAGFQRNLKEMYELAQQGRIYVLPTHFDGLPGSVREAMFLKIPVITTPVGALPSLNIEKQCIVLSEVGNPEKLGGNIRRLLTDVKLYQELQENAYDKANKVFSNNDILNQLLFMYSQLT